MMTILFNGHDFKFLKLLIDYYKQRPGCQVIIDDIPGHAMSHIESSLLLLKKADLVFCEWALGNAVWYSQNKKEHQKLVIRVHNQEMTLPYLDTIYWPNVDKIIFICPKNLELFQNRYPALVPKSCLIYNLIDCNDFNVPKMPGSEFNLGLMGTAPKIKAPHLAFEILQKIRRIDDRYTLHIKGKHPWEYNWLWRREDERIYYEDLYREINTSCDANAVIFDSHGNDVSVWFSKIGFILSTSDREGSHQSVAEGMASGAIPVIRNWAGASKIYPPQFVFASVDEAVELIQTARFSKGFSDQVEEIQRFSFAHFDLPVIINQYNQLFDTLFSATSGSFFSSITLTNPKANEPLNVVHVCYLNPGNQSGYEVRVIEETSVLVKQGVKVYIAGFYNLASINNSDLVEPYRCRMETLTGATVFLYPTTHFFDLNVGDEMKLEIDGPLIELALLYKVSIFHGQALYATSHALRAADTTGTKVVFDSHGVAPEETKMSGGHENRVTTLHHLEHLALKKASLKIFVSECMKQHFHQKHGMDVGNYFQLPCCVHSGEFIMSPEERKKIRDDKHFNEKTVFLYLGTLSVWQWPEAMFNMFSRFHEKNPDSIIYILAPTYDHSKALDFITKFHLPQGSYLLEEVAHKEVGKIIGVADVGILLREFHVVNLVSSPTKFGEYLAAGVPVILSKGIGDYSEMAEAKRLGITLNLNGKEFPIHQQEKLQSFVQDVMQNREKWASRCMQVAKKELEWDVFGSHLVNIYRSLQHI